MKVFLTGASSGIGVALARAYAASETPGSLTLGLFARRQEALQEVAGEIATAYGHKVVTYIGDVRVPADLQHAGAEFLSRSLPDSACPTSSSPTPAFRAGP